MTDTQEKDELPLGITLAEGKPNDSPSHPTERDRERSDSSHNSSNPDIPEGTKYPPSHHQQTSDVQATVAEANMLNKEQDNLDQEKTVPETQQQSLQKEHAHNVEGQKSYDK